MAASGRPVGLCDDTQDIMPRVCQASSVGTANAGVPMNTIRNGYTSSASASFSSARLKLSALSVKSTRQVIGFMLKDYRQQVVAVHKISARPIMCLNLHLRRSPYLPDHPRNRQASFLLAPLPGAIPPGLKSVWGLNRHPDYSRTATPTVAQPAHPWSTYVSSISAANWRIFHRSQLPAQPSGGAPDRPLCVSPESTQLPPQMVCCLATL